MRKEGLMPFCTFAKSRFTPIVDYEYRGQRVSCKSLWPQPIPQVAFRTERGHEIVPLFVHIV